MSGGRMYRGGGRLEERQSDGADICGEWKENIEGEGQYGGVETDDTTTEEGDGQ